MIIFIHVAVAILGIVLSTIGLISPSKQIIYSTRLCGGFTLVSGVALSIFGSGSVAKSCLTGMVYLSATMIASSLANKKLQAN